MARSLNQCNFIGNLGRDPEARVMPNGNAVTNFSIAVSDSYKDKQSGQKVDVTEWVRCVAFGRLGEIVAEYLHKGSKVYISGRMKTQQWEKDGVKQYTTEIVVDNLQMLDSRQQGQQSGGQGDNPFASSQSQQSQARPAQAAPANFDNFDDDIPF